MCFVRHCHRSLSFAMPTATQTEHVILRFRCIRSLPQESESTPVASSRIVCPRLCQSYRYRSRSRCRRMPKSLVPQRQPVQKPPTVARARRAIAVSKQNTVWDCCQESHVSLILSFWILWFLYSLLRRFSHLHLHILGLSVRMEVDIFQCYYEIWSHMLHLCHLDIGISWVSFALPVRGHVVSDDSHDVFALAASFVFYSIILGLWHFTWYDQSYCHILSFALICLILFNLLCTCASPRQHTSTSFVHNRGVSWKEGVEVFPEVVLILGNTLSFTLFLSFHLYFGSWIKSKNQLGLTYSTSTIRIRLISKFPFWECMQ